MSSFADDPIVALYGDRPDDGFVVRERVFHRLVQIAKAYELHQLPQLGGSDPVTLRGPMIQTLLDELRFVGERLNDPVNDLWVGRLLPVVQAALWSRTEARLTVEGE